MNAKRINEIRSKVQVSKPLVHAVTNPISINQCANAVLALGARPIMAEHPKEVREITETAAALLLNLGNITDVRMESMKISAKRAKEKGIPVVIDAVGVACSKLRRDFINELLNITVPDVIKGNYSEIMSLADENYISFGVDADDSLTKEKVKNTAIKLAKEKKTVVLASGKIDLVTDGKQTVFINNGTPLLSQVTGTGCMLGIISAVLLSSGSAFEAAVAAASVLGICGEMAETEKGSGTFMVNLLDALSTVSDNEIEKYLKINYEKEVNL